MNLLIVTQKVDKNDSVLGFFHGWIEKFAEKFEKITVICLEKGEVDLPENVKVFSLGKEAASEKLQVKSNKLEVGKCSSSTSSGYKVGSKKLKVLRQIIYILKFYGYIWRERKNYDVVFVHMNQEYVLLGGLVWKVFKKKVFLWRNHPKGSFLTRVAVWLSDKVFYTSPFSYTARFRKGVMMPVGVNFEPKVYKVHKVYKEDSLKILYLGRIAPVKNIETIIEAGKILSERGINFKLDIIGDALEKDKEYYESLKLQVKSLKLEKEVKFLEGVANEETPEIYAAHDIFVNATEIGSMDKTIFEAIFSGLPVITSNRALKDFFGWEYADLLLFKEEDVGDLALKVEKAKDFLSSFEGEKMVLELRKKMEEEQSLEKLSEKLFEIFKKEKNNA